MVVSVMLAGGERRMDANANANANSDSDLPSPTLPNPTDCLHYSRPLSSPLARCPLPPALVPLARVPSIDASTWETLQDETSTEKRYVRMSGITRKKHSGHLVLRYLSWFTLSAYSASKIFSARAPPQGAPGGSGQLNTPRKRPAH